MASGGAEGGQRHQYGGDTADGGHRQLRLCVGDQQHHHQQEHGAAGDEGPPIRDGGGGVWIGDIRGALTLTLPQDAAEAEVEVQHCGHQTDQHDNAGVGEEIEEGQTQRGTDDDVGGIAAHGGTAAQIGTEDLRQDHGNRVEAQGTAQLRRDGGQKQNDGDAVDEHGQHGCHDHEAHQQRHGAVMDRLGQLQAQPAKDAHVAHALHHHHHARNEHDGGPVDAAGGLRCAVPEGALAEGGQVQGIPYGPAIVHTDAEYQHQHQCAAAQRHPLAGDAVQHDQQEHDDKNYQRCNFSYHRKFASF